MKWGGGVRSAGLSRARGRGCPLGLVSAQARPGAEPRSAHRAFICGCLPWGRAALGGYRLCPARGPCVPTLPGHPGGLGWREPPGLLAGSNTMFNSLGFSAIKPLARLQQMGLLPLPMSPQAQPQSWGGGDGTEAPLCPPPGCQEEAAVLGAGQGGRGVSRGDHFPCDAELFPFPIPVHPKRRCSLGAPPARLD